MNTVAVTINLPIGTISPYDFAAAVQQAMHRHAHEPMTLAALGNLATLLNTAGAYAYPIGLGQQR